MRTNQSGGVLIFVLIAMIAIVATVALAVDIGLQITVKEQSIAAAEMSAARGVSELYVPDYVALTLPANDGATIPGLDDDKWASQFQGNAARSAAHDLGAEHMVGWTASGTPYAPDIQLNGGNLDAGDIRLGNWIKSAGGPFGFVPSPATVSANADLARAIEVVVRRESAAKVPGVSEGDDPIPVTFGRIFGVTGTQVRSTIVVKVDPAAVVGEGAVVPTSDGSTAVTGAMPLALRHVGTVQQVRPGPAANVSTTAWITAADPATMVRIRITKDGSASNGGGVAYAGTLYFVSFPSLLGGNRKVRLERRLAFMAQKPSPVAGETMEAPPSVWIGSTLNGPGEGDGGPLNNNDLSGYWSAFFDPAGNNRFVNRTWVLPVVANGGANDRQAIGFLRVYCEAARLLQIGNGQGDSIIEVDLRLAPSASARNSGTLNSLNRLSTPVAAPAALLSSHFGLFWETDAIDGVHAGPRSFGVSCASATATYHP
ncbi:MAG TPA: hypothetical protein VEN81_11100 [Planctomycetota bacterium]|nr:hypothetical protein [Planctomycetota bacterium]